MLSSVVVLLQIARNMASRLTPPPKPPQYLSTRPRAGASSSPHPDPEQDIDTVPGGVFTEDFQEKTGVRVHPQVSSLPAQPPVKATETPLSAVFPARAAGTPGRMRLPTWSPWALGVLAGFVGSGVGAAGAIWLMVGHLEAPAAATTPVATNIAAPSPSALAPQVPRAAVSTGAPNTKGSDLVTVPPPKRSAAEAVAVARFTLGDEIDQLGRLRERLQANPALAHDPGTRKRLLDAARDEALALDALAVIAELPGPESADLLYVVWTSRVKRTRGTALAEALVYSKDVLPKASPELRVALDLRRAQDCKEISAILPRAVEFGDRRSLRPLGNFNSPRMRCGASGKEDCYACVRHTRQLTQAIRATMRRKPPRYE